MYKMHSSQPHYLLCTPAEYRTKCNVFQTVVIDCEVCSDLPGRLKEPQNILSCTKLANSLSSLPHSGEVIFKGRCSFFPVVLELL